MIKYSTLIVLLSIFYVCSCEEDQATGLTATPTPQPQTLNACSNDIIAPKKDIKAIPKYSVKLKWKYFGDDSIETISDFEIQSKRKKSDGSYTSWKTEKLVDEDKRSFSVKNLNPGTYKFRIRSVCFDENKSKWRPNKKGIKVKI